MEAKHTPGPWDFHRRQIRSGHYAAVAVANLADRGDETKHNARLIAAAPDLLAACERALLRLGAYPGNPATIKALEEAIAKATGA